MYRENKFTEALDWLWGWLLALSPLWPVSVVALIFWVGEHHPTVYIWILAGVFSIVFLWALLVALEFAGIVLGGIINLFHR